jgi:hypothetical protein
VIVTVGAIVSTENVRDAVDELPAASLTRTSNWWLPFASVTDVNGDVHAANAAASIRHCVEVGDPAVVNVNRGAGSFVGPVGPPVIVTVGACVSTTQVAVALPTLPAVSVAWTVNVWLPSAIPVSASGEVHAANAPPSSLHWSVPSVVVKVNVADDEFDGFAGPLVIVTTGRTVSMENARLAVDELPAASLTRTSNWWFAFDSVPEVNGDVHAANAAASMRHWIVVGEPAVVNVKVGVASLVGPVGPPVIVTVGACVSTTHVELALPTLPAASVAWTVKV